MSHTARHPADDEPQRLDALRPALRLRAHVLKTIRDHFTSDGFLEVETPVRLAAPALETHIDAEPSGTAFLRTSPELHMKRMLAAGYDRIFQMGPCFRQGERGDRHHPEYTMLEWYRTGTDYLGILDDTRALFAAIDPQQNRDWPLFRVADAFIQWAGWNPVTDYDADRFDLDLVEKVEPALARYETPVVLIDYPAPAGAFARLKADNPLVAERWELYWKGVELANAYSELIDPVEQAARFREAAHARAAAGKPVYPIDEAFLASLRHGLPPCGGIALGVDRLVMCLLGTDSLATVTAFQE